LIHFYKRNGSSDASFNQNGADKFSPWILYP